MKNFFQIFFTICLLIVLIYFGLRYGFGIPNIDFLKLNPFKKSDLEQKADDLKKRIEYLEFKSDSLQPILLKYQKQTDSLMTLDSLIDLKIFDLKQKDLQLDRKLSQSRDSLNKYRNNMKDMLKKYEDMKKKGNSTNKETLDFFKKY